MARPVRYPERVRKVSVACALLLTLASMVACVAAGGKPAARGEGGPAVAGAACPGSLRAEGRLSIRVDGTRRHFLLRLPEDYDGERRRPLVFVFHGFTQGAREIERVMSFPTAWPEAVVVYPLGLPRRFASIPGAEGPGWQIAPGELGDRDVDFFDALLAWIDARTCVDPGRVYVAGVSNGSFFAQLLACLRPQRIAGVAAVAGGMRCLPRGEVPVLLSHGREDTVVPFSEDTRAEAAWAERNGCGEAREPAGTGCEARRACAGGEVVFCAHDEGHAFRDPAFLDRAVAFFRRHRRGSGA